MPDILIAPQRGTSNNPQIFFTGSVQTSASIRMEVLPEGQIAFLGKSGSLFSISDSMVGSLMAVSDISGLPILEVFSDDKVVMGKYNSNALVVTGSSVSIGKSVPNAKFDVSGSAAISGSLTATNGLYSADVVVASSGLTAGFWLAPTPTAAAFGYLWHANSTISLIANSGRSLSFSTNGTEKVRIDTSGNFGIGSTNPLAKLHILSSTPSGVTSIFSNSDIVIDSSTNSYINFRQSADTGAYGGFVWTDNNHGAYIVFRNWQGSAATGGDSLIYGTTQDHIFQAGTAATVNGRSEVMRIMQNGNVGIGTNNPSSLLHLYTTGTSAELLVEKSSTYANRLGVNSSNIAYVGSTNATALQLQTNGTARVYIDTSGNVGIGTTSPVYKLHAAGDIYADGGWFRVSGGNGIYWQTYGGGWYMNESTYIRSYNNKVVMGYNTGGSSGTATAFWATSGNTSNYFGNNQLVLSFEQNTTYAHAIKSRHNAGAVAGNAIDFYTWKQGTDTSTTIGTQHVMSLNGPNVGIGTTSPTAKLEVAGDVMADNVFNPFLLMGA
jgi:hypothetical protein